MTSSVEAGTVDALAAVRSALDKVIDPCALVNGTKLSLTDLGMISDVTVGDGVIHIDLLLDDPLCLYMGAIHQEIRDRISAELPGHRVEIAIRGDVIWTSELATPGTRQKIAEWQRRRTERLSRRPVPLAAPAVRRPGEEQGR